MSQPRTMSSVALTNHASNNAWRKVKPLQTGGASTCKLFCDSTEDFYMSLEQGAAADAGDSNTDADDLRDANKVKIDGVALAAVFDFGSGVTEAIWVKKVAAAATDETITCIW